MIEQTIQIPQNRTPILKAMEIGNTIGSLGEGRRLIMQKAVRINYGEPVRFRRTVSDGDTVRIGKNRVYTVVLNKDPLDNCGACESVERFGAELRKLGNIEENK